ncbi:Ig domain containing protein [Euroglyphus maynei]|uniref:Ig domain containing protein n=1 Tax=Euroglyphus maynei TaxID=6958 RepID=A0A1Y3BUA3_EURMA|nr:Ig domain containing protein [Euroglyphus maynei]
MFRENFIIIFIPFLLLPNRLLSELLAHHQAPKLAENIHNQTLLIGSKFKFFCYLQASGSRPLHFEWLKDGQILRHYGGDRQTSSYTIATTEDDTLFSIDKIRLNDSGNYTCLVRNSFGSDSKTISLTIKAKSHVTKQLHDWLHSDPANRK